MSNMSYCRFENTAQDLADCVTHVDEELGGHEFNARAELVRLCGDILTGLDIDFSRTEMYVALSRFENMDEDDDGIDEDEDDELTEEDKNDLAEQEPDDEDEQADGED